MTPSSLIRASGLCAVLGGICFVLFPVLHPDHDAAAYASATWAPIHLMPNVGAILILLGLVGLLARQLDRAGLFGVIAFLVAFFGTASFVMGAMIEAFILPYFGLMNPAFEEGPPPAGVGEAFMAISVLLAVGHVLLGVATYRAGVLPRSVGALLIVGAVAMFGAEKVGMLLLGTDVAWGIGPVLLGAAIAWLGWNLWSDTPATRGTARPSGRGLADTSTAAGYVAG